jgi:hypothetical protein
MCEISGNQEFVNYGESGIRSRRGLPIRCNAKGDKGGDAKGPVTETINSNQQGNSGVSVAGVKGDVGNSGVSVSGVKGDLAMTTNTTTTDHDSVQGAFDVTSKALATIESTNNQTIGKTLEFARSSSKDAMDFALSATNDTEAQATAMKWGTFAALGIAAAAVVAARK